MGEFVTLEVKDGVGTIRLDRPPVNALNAQVTAELAELAKEATERDDVRAVILYGGEKTFAGGADIKEMATPHLPRDREVRRHPHRHPRGHREHPEAGRRRHHRLRPRRRPRTGADRGPPGRRRQRQGRPARDPARRHPRRGRHPAPGPADRPEQDQGHRLHRTVRQGRRGAGARASSTRSSPPTTSTRPRTNGRRSSRTARPSRCARRRRPSTAASTPTWRAGSSWRSHLFAALLATEDQRNGMQSFIENGPGKATFKGK